MNQKFTNKHFQEELHKRGQDHISEKDLNRARAKAHKLGEQMTNFLIMLELVKDCMTGKYKIEIGSLIVMIGAILYVISPFDLIPDFAPFIGLLDDIAMITFIFTNMGGIFEPYTLSKQSQTESQKDIVIDTTTE